MELDLELGLAQTSRDLASANQKDGANKWSWKEAQSRSLLYKSKARQVWHLYTFLSCYWQRRKWTRQLVSCDNWAKVLLYKSGTPGWGNILAPTMCPMNTMLGMKNKTALHFHLNVLIPWLSTKLSMRSKWERKSQHHYWYSISIQM